MRTEFDPEAQSAPGAARPGAEGEAVAHSPSAILQEPGPISQGPHPEAQAAAGPGQEAVSAGIEPAAMTLPAAGPAPAAENPQSELEPAAPEPAPKPPRPQAPALPFRASVLTLYPEMFPGPLGHALSGRGLERGLWGLEAVQIRDFALDRHRSVDDTPAGGGPGMVMRADVLARAIDAVAPADDPRPRLLMTPRGRPLTQERVRALAAGPGVVILCGRFEGVDERIVAARALEEVCVGDVVLSGGEAAALLLLDACVRLIPGVMGKAQSGEDESFSHGLLEYPQYTRPQVFEGMEIPPVLVSGDHARINRWRGAQALAATRARRPDLLAADDENLTTGE